MARAGAPLGILGPVKRHDIGPHANTAQLLHPHVQSPHGSYGYPGVADGPYLSLEARLGLDDC